MPRKKHWLCSPLVTMTMAVKIDALSEKEDLRQFNSLHLGQSRGGGYNGKDHRTEAIRSHVSTDEGRLGGHSTLISEFAQADIQQKMMTGPTRLQIQSNNFGNNYTIKQM